MTRIQELLSLYQQSCEDPQINFDLGAEYENLGHTGSASSFYLRCAERSQDDLLSYTALIRCGLCYMAQGRRNFTASHLFRQAICLLPLRPEAYYFLAILQDLSKNTYEAYTNASIALGIIEKNDTLQPIQILPEYLGRQTMMFVKANNGVYWEKHEESVKLYRELISLDGVTSEILDKSKINLDVLEKKYPKLANIV